MQYFVPVPEMNSNVLTLLAISLPLTSIWASAAIKHSFETVDSVPHRHLWSGTASSASPNGSGQMGSEISQYTTTTASLKPYHLDRLYPELEAGIAIDTDLNFNIGS
jgi:pheromone alpha factor receptor